MTGGTAEAGRQAKRILVIDDDPLVAESLAEFLCEEGYEASSALSPSEALTLLDAAAKGDDGGSPIGLVICDVTLPPVSHEGETIASGMDLLRIIGRKHLGTVVIMLTGYGTIETAVEALRFGAVDFLTKPVIDDELRLALERAVRQQTLLQENLNLKSQLDSRFGLDNIVGHDHRMQRTYELVEAVAPSRTTVLMSGESGTGKSLIAHAIHQRSPRAARPFVEISCGSIPETLLESELFGHVKGAFTGAHADKAGRFLAADGGTIFLDEINSASPAMQLKLLRVLQERKFEPVGSDRTIEVDVRVILASNQSLERLVAEGSFRQDLYYRINVVKVELPPLRDRTSDVPILAEHFLAKHAADLGKTLAGFTPDAMDALRRYPFPGNVRELANIVERAAVLCRGQTIAAADLPPHVLSGEDQGLLPQNGRRDRGGEGEWVPMPLTEALKEPERKIIMKALEANEWNRQHTADQLGINRTTLYKKMKALGIEDAESDAA